MKVILTTRSVYPINGIGGMEHFVFMLAKYLLAQGLEVEVITSSGSDYKLARYEIDGVPINVFPIFLPPHSLVRRSIQYRKYVAQLSKYLENTKFDILHAIGLTALDYLKVPNHKPVLVQQFANEMFRDRRILVRLWNYLIWYRQARYCMHSAELIGSLGPKQSVDIASLFNVSPGKICEISDGIEFDKIQNSCKDPTCSRKDLDIGDELVFITVNRLVSAKRIDWIIKGFCQFQKKYSNAKLIIVGSGIEKENLTKLIGHLKLDQSVMFFENVSDDSLFSLLHLSDIYVNASSQHTILISVMNAMGVGLPVISTDDQEGFVQNYVSGLQTKQESIEGIADAMFKLSERSDLKIMGRTAVELAKTHDWNNIAKIAIFYYKKIIKV